MARALIACAACRDSPAPETTGGLAPPAPEQVLRSLSPRANIPVVLHTSEGDVHCGIDAEKAPRGAALFLGLAMGRAAHRDSASDAVTTDAFYVHRRFVRAVPGIFVQTGCPRDDGTGHPGYRIEPEPHPEDAGRLGRGALFFATYTPAPGRRDPDPPPPGHTIGSQFVIALTSMKHLAGTTTVLGHCTDLDVVERIAQAQSVGREPLLESMSVETGPR